MAVVAGLAGLAGACSVDEGGGSAPPVAEEALFVDGTEVAGLHFRHVAGAAGAYHLPEITGAGVALLDYDGDGDLDTYLLQGGQRLPGVDDGAEPLVSAPDVPAGNRLFRNDLVRGGELAFTDVTDEAGVGDTGYAMGVAVGDYDNDGDPDLYVTNVGPNVLYRNEGDGRFSDVTREAGVDDSRWNTSAAFLDYDADGDLDLYVAAYVEFDPATSKPCDDPAGRADYCAPGRYPPLADRLFRNDGEGRFKDVSRQTGIAEQAGPGLGAVGADLDGDGQLEILVANDQSANFLWRRTADGRFEDRGLMRGVAYNAEGAAEASMGIAAGDADGDGDDDLFMTHLVTETNTFYVNDGAGRFTDRTAASNLGAVSLRSTGFGAGFLDVDGDGDLDLFAANGAVAMIDARVGVSSYPYEEPDQLFENLGDGRFADISERAGLTAMPPLVGRGAAFGDIDNDGDVDILVSNNNGPARLLLNASAPASHLTVTLVGTRSNRDGQGARIGLSLTDGRTAWRRVHSDGSYASASDRRVVFPLGPGSTPIAVSVRWPVGNEETWPVTVADGGIVLVEGQGQLAAGT